MLAYLSRWLSVAQANVFEQRIVWLARNRLVAIPWFNEQEQASLLHSQSSGSSQCYCFCALPMTLRRSSHVPHPLTWLRILPDPVPHDPTYGLVDTPIPPPIAACASLSSRT